MAKKRFTFADAKEKIKDLESALDAALDDAKLVQDNNVYDAGEQKWIKFYQFGFIISLLINIMLAFTVL